MAAAALLWLILAALFVVKLDGRALDDFYITYTYAENLAAGRGFVFNPGERVFGLTDPGMGLLLAALHRLTRIPVHRLATLVTAAALVAMALLLLAESRQSGRSPEALLGGTLALASSFLWVTHGSAWPPALVLLLLAARWGEGRPWLAGMAAGLAVGFRPDAGLGVGVVGLSLWLARRRLPYRFALAAAGTIAAAAVGAWLYFGTPLPQTLFAKRAMAVGDAHSTAGWTAFWPRALPLLQRHFGPGWWLLAGLGIAGLLPWYRSAGPAGRMTVLYAALLAVAYPLLGVPFFPWYVAPSIAAVLYGVAHLAGGAARWPARRSVGRGPATALGLGVAAVLLALALASYLPATAGWHRRFAGFAHQETYRRAALWIRDHSQPEERIAYVEIGVLGYYGRRPVRDLMGLVTPEVLPYARAGDLVGAFLVAPTELVLFHSRGRMRPLVTAPWFGRAYREVARFEDRGSRRPGAGLTVYRRRPGAELPPPRPPRHRPPARAAPPRQGDALR